jgi:alpha-1,6-mannosyltransferase
VKAGARGGVQALGTAALGVAVGLSVALALVAAERPSFLSGPARHGFPPWMVGPLAHLVPGLPDSPPALQSDLTRVLVALGIAWVVATLCAGRLPSVVVWAAVVGAQVALLLGPPLSLTDLFNYLHYGRMHATYGLNPYVALPTAAPADAAYPFSNWRRLPSPYGPLFTLLSEGLAPLRLSAAYWMWKAIALAGSLGTLALVALTARRLGRSPRRAVAFVGLNPLVLVYGIGGAHNEPLVLLCATAAVALAAVGRDAITRPWWDAGAGACAVLAAGFKPSAALVAPVVVLGCRRRVHALAGAAGAGALVLAVVGLRYGGHLPATGIQDRLVTPLSVPNVLAALAGQGGETAADRALAHAALGLAAVAAALVVMWRRAWLPGAVGAVMLAAVLTLGWTMPWYVWWVLPFAALARTRWLAGACIVLTAWLALGAIPQMPKLLHDAGYYPTRSAVGRANHFYTERYLR